MADDRELDAAFERGRRIGQLEGIPFQGIQSFGSWLPGTRFAFDDSWFESFVRYERSVIENLRLVQRMRWLLRRGAAEAKARILLAGHSSLTLAELEREIIDELLRVRWAVDAEIEEGRGRTCVVAALRAVPQRPASVVEYPNSAAFVEQNRRRAAGDRTGPKIRPGADFGYDWNLENPFMRWDTTRWCISWLCGPNKLIFEDEERLYGDEGDTTHEVYAIETLVESSERYSEDGRVWLLGTVHTYAAMELALADLRLHAMRERNSLIAAADAIAVAAAKEGRRPSAGDPG